MKIKPLFFSFLILFAFSASAAPKKAPVLAPEVVPHLNIVIDPGHGGKDPGAISKKKVREKDVVLGISKKLAVELKKRLKARVFLTRSNDKFISLKERNQLAQQKSCDLFLSIHGNAAKNKKAKGVEIYYLNKATDEAARRLAERENEGAPEDEKALDAIVSDLIQTASTEESAELATHVKKTMTKSLKKHGVASVKVKTALFYVLVGSKCPSLLIETGFVTNPQEGKKLKQAAYQKVMAQAIAAGVVQFMKNADNPGSDL